MVVNIVPDTPTVSAYTEGVRGYPLDRDKSELLWKNSAEMVSETFC